MSYSFNRRQDDVTYEQLSGKRDAWVAKHAGRPGSSAGAPKTMHAAVQLSDQPLEVSQQADDWLWEWAERRDQLKETYSEARATGASESELAEVWSALQRHMALDNLPEG